MKLQVNQRMGGRRVAAGKQTRTADRRIHSWILALTLVAGVGLAQPGMAATVASLGVDSTSLDAWRSTNVVKLALFDPNGDNAYGSDGYYVRSGGSTLSNLPAYISSVTLGSINPYPSSTFGFDDPTQPIGPNVSNINGIWYVQTQPQGVYESFFTITLAANTNFVLTTIVGTHLAGNTTSPTNDVFAPQAVRVTGPGSISAAQTGLSQYAGHPDYVFFHISGNAGDTFTVSLLTSSGTGDSRYGGATTSGLGFDTVPEPSAAVLLCLGGLALLRRRSRGSVRA